MAQIPAFERNLAVADPLTGGRRGGPLELDFEPLDEAKMRQTILEAHPEWRARMIRYMLREIILHLLHRSRATASDSRPAP